VASPPYEAGQVVTYIDYDLDVIHTWNGETQLVDEDEYERHKTLYHYSPAVEAKVKAGLSELLGLVERRGAPFHDEWAYAYYEMWKRRERTGKA
jgi:protein associated with RNAse G/E